MRTDHHSGRAYTQVELDFIRGHADLRPRQLADLFNATFGRYAEPKRMSQWLRRMGIEPNLRREHKYSDEQREWLAANASTMSEKELTAAFNARYGTSVSKDALRGYVKRFIGVKRTKEAAHKHRCEAQRRYYPGDVSVQTRGGRKVKVIMTDEYKWVPYGRYLYEQANGPLPDGNVVVFLNNDATDCRMDNMVAVGQDVLALMARNQWHSEDPDVTKTAIMLCILSRLSNGQIRV